MSITRVSVHDIRGGPAGLGWAAKGNCVKAMGSTGVIREARPGALLLYRWPFEVGEQDDILEMRDATRVLNAILGGLGGFRHPNLYVETLNEVGKGGLEPYLALLESLVPMLHSAGLKVAGPSWATGDYEQADWDAFRSRGWCGLDLIALHCYWASAGFTEWNALRYRTYWRTGDPPIVITECGRDRVRDGNPNVNNGYLPTDNSGNYGWQAQGLTADQFAAELTAYDAELTKDPYVLGATVFTTSPTDDWKNKGFDCDPVAAQIGAATEAWNPVPTPIPPEEETMDGIDVSNHQGPAVDWNAIAQAGKSFAFMKASEDPDFRDPHFARNWQQSKASGLVRGAYHFARPSESSPAASVTLLQQMLESVGGAQPGDLIALDIEDTNVPANQNLSQWVAEWLALAEQALGVKPVIYSGMWYMQPHGLLSPALGEYPLWYASYQPNPPPVPTGWQTISFWQHSSSGTVPGISGDCDLNRFFGAAADLAALGKAHPVAPPNNVYEANAWGPIFQASQFLFGTGNQGDAEDANDLLTLLTRNKARHGA